PYLSRLHRGATTPADTRWICRIPEERTGDTASSGQIVFDTAAQQSHRCYLRPLLPLRHSPSSASVRPDVSCEVILQLGSSLLAYPLYRFFQAGQQPAFKSLLDLSRAMIVVTLRRRSPPPPVLPV